MIDHLDDLESDFSAIHRVDDIYELDGPRFMRLAYRIFAYQGVMRMQIEKQQAEDEQRRGKPTARPGRSSSIAQRPREVPVAVAVASCPDEIEWKQVG